MNKPLLIARLFFLFFSLSFLIITFLTKSTLYALFCGVGMVVLLLVAEGFLKRFNLASLNTITVGVFLGYLVGKSFVLTFTALVQQTSFSQNLDWQLVDLFKGCLFFLGSYLGVIMTLRYADEFYLSIPFVKFSALAHKKKDLILDGSVLSDARIVDLASSGLVDHHLILPRFLLKDFYAHTEMGDELFRMRAKRALEVVKKLEQIPGLELRIHEADFPDIKDSMSKVVHLARTLDGMVLTADISRIQISTLEGVRVINIHALSNALKPLMQAGEKIKIKVQRFGKEPRQGVGYLEDGTMVVINGGGDFVGEIIEALVLSVKHTSSGRMIFCNALDFQESFQPEYDEIDGNR